MKKKDISERRVPTGIALYQALWAEADEAAEIAGMSRSRLMEAIIAEGCTAIIEGRAQIVNGKFVRVEK